MNVKHLVFVHIPKTAGTSFRKALEKKVGAKRICMDYSLENDETSLCVRDMYENADLYSFWKDFTRLDYKVLAGHFGAWRYVSLFPAQSMVTFLRDPVKRFLSEFSHHKRIQGYKGSLEDFCMLDRTKNMQSRVMNVPRQALGLVGITERYEDSLALFADRFGLKLPSFRENTDPENMAQSITVTKDQLEMISLINADDINLYEKALFEFDEQVKYLRSGKEYTFSRIHFQTNNRLVGWAFKRNNDTPVNLKFYLNGAPYKTVKANTYRWDVNLYGDTRRGHSGVVLNLPDTYEIDSLQCIVEETGQQIEIEY